MLRQYLKYFGHLKRYDWMGGSSWKAGLMGKEDEEGIGDSGRRT